MKKVFLCAAALVMFGCAAKMDMNIISPASNSAVIDYKNVAVWDISTGKDDGAYTLKFEETIASLKFDGKPIFMVNSGKAIKKMRAEKSVSPDDGAAVIEVGAALGVDAVWFGTLTEDYSETSYKRTKNSCDEIKPGGPGDNCGSYLTICTRKTLTVVADMRLVSAVDGEVVYVGVISGDAESDMCSDESSWLSEKDLRGQAVDKIAVKFSHEIAPHESALKVGIMTDNDGIMDAASLNLFENGIGFTKERRMDKACNAWNKAFERSPHAVSLMYNVALCMELDGNYEGALALLEELDQILPPAGFMNKINNFFRVQDLPNNLVVEAIARNKKHIADANLIKEQTGRD